MCATERHDVPKAVSRANEIDADAYSSSHCIVEVHLPKPLDELQTLHLSPIPNRIDANYQRYDYRLFHHDLLNVGQNLVPLLHIDLFIGSLEQAINYRRIEP